MCYAVAKLCRSQYSEAEVTSYVDGMCLGDSVAVFVDILADGSLTEEGIRILRIRDVLNPNGPWQSRNLRLRAHALKDAALSEAWKISQAPGTKLAPDFMTKAITVASSGLDFASLWGRWNYEEVETYGKIAACKDLAMRAAEFFARCRKA